MNTTIAYDQLESIYALAQLRDQGASAYELEFLTISRLGGKVYADAGTHRIVFTSDEVREWLRLVLSADDTREAV